jgi:hypothetical protein
VTSEQIDLIVSMYRADESYGSIAKELGISVNVVKYWIRSNRKAYELAHRRNLAEKCGALSDAAWDDSKWNIKAGFEWIKRRWT